MAKRPTRRKPAPEMPTCNCVLLCDDVVTSAHGKHNLIGVIGTIAVPRVPALIGGYVTYVRLSNLYPRQSAHIELERTEDRVVIFRFEVRLEQADPLGVYTLVAVVPPFPVERTGRYMFQAVAGGIPLAQSPIQIVSVGRPGAGDGRAS